MGLVGQPGDAGDERPSSALMTTNVRRALSPCGGRKMLTPLEIASRPVSDEPPFANDFSRM